MLDLDIWLAEHIFGWQRRQKVTAPLHADDGDDYEKVGPHQWLEDPQLHVRVYFCQCEDTGDLPRASVQPAWALSGLRMLPGDVLPVRLERLHGRWYCTLGGVTEHAQLPSKAVALALKAWKEAS